MRRISNKEITTDFFGGKNCNTYGRKKNNSPISLIYKELKQMSSLQTNSDHLNRQKIRGMHSIKKMDNDKRRPLKLFIMIIFIVLTFVWPITHHSFHPAPQNAFLKMSLLL